MHFINVYKLEFILSTHGDIINGTFGVSIQYLFKIWLKVSIYSSYECKSIGSRSMQDIFYSITLAATIQIKSYLGWFFPIPRKISNLSRKTSWVKEKSWPSTSTKAQVQCPAQLQKALIDCAQNIRRLASGLMPYTV